MKKIFYILIIIFVAVQTFAQKEPNQNIALNTSLNSLSILPQFSTNAPDFLDELLPLKKGNEYTYWALRFGMSHGFSAQPSLNENKYLDNVPVASTADEMQAIPVGSFIGYVPGFVLDFYFHYDFVTESAGIFVGIEYNYYGMSSKYETKTGGYTAVEKNMVNSIGIPLAFKYGPKFYKKQAYIYAGIKYNFNLTMTSVQKVSWASEKAMEKVDAEQIKRSNFGVFLGINYLAFNIQFDYIPGNFLNTDYTNPSGYYPATGQPDKLFFLSTSINVPISNGWIGTRNRTLKKFFKKLRFW